MLKKYTFRVVIYCQAVLGSTGKLHKVRLLHKYVIMTFMIVICSLRKLFINLTNIDKMGEI